MTKKNKTSASREILRIDNGSIGWTLIKCVFVMLPLGFISAVGINAFLMPHNLLSGGFSGFAMLFNYLWGWPVWLVVLAYNIPLFIVGIFKVNFKFILMTAFGMAGYSFFLNLTQGWDFGVQNELLGACFGGVLGGIASGVSVRLGGSIGGLDVIAVILNRKLSFSFGGIVVFFNVLVMLSSMLAFDVERALLTLVSVFVGGRVADNVLMGINRCKTVLVVSEKHKTFAPILLEEMGRGITYLQGEGAYTGETRKICYCVVRTMELAKLKDIIKQVDPHAFITVIDTKESSGGRGLDLSKLY